MIFLYWFNAFWVVENIAFNKTTWQQNSDPRFNWGADRVVDGKYSDLSADGGQCTITTFGKNKTEWRVDLREVSSIYCIFIQYRTDNQPWGKIFFFNDFCSLVRCSSESWLHIQHADIIGLWAKRSISFVNNLYYVFSLKFSSISHQM